MLRLLLSMTWPMPDDRDGHEHQRSGQHPFPCHHRNEVLSRSTIRLFALLVLLFSGVETLVCDVLFHESHKQSASSTSASQQSDDEDCGCTDGCLCCCTHVIPAPAFTLASLGPLALITSDPPQASPRTTHIRIEHPPRS